MFLIHPRTRLLLLLPILCAVAGCPPKQTSSFSISAVANALSAVDLSSPTQPQKILEQVNVSGARNATCSFAVRLDCTQFPAHPRLRFTPFVQGTKQLNSGITISAFQVLHAPVDLDDASFVRQTGQAGAVAMVPRVLLPLPVSLERENPCVDLSAAHDPAQPAHVGVRPGSGSILVWVDVKVSDQTAAGQYVSHCELTDVESDQSIGTMPVNLTVQNVTLPNEPHLHFAAPLDWEQLARFNPDIFSTTTPRLLNRSEPAKLELLKKINNYLQLAHANRADFYVPRLQPVVKWPLGKPPEIDWADFDSVVAPWLNGSAFADHLPVAFWPLPAPDSLNLFDLSTQVQYWHAAARHFDHDRWLERSPVVLSPDAAGEINQAESLLLCAQAQKVLAAYPRIEAMLPLHDDQILFSTGANPNAIDPDSTTRLRTASPGLVYPSPMRDWPGNSQTPRHWVDAGAKDGSCDVTGTESEQGIRTLASLAFARDASLILCNQPLPWRANEPAPANQLIWCYPGEAFGVDQPLATLQLKWIRQAEQDYEYLFLASQKKDQATALKMSRLIARPVQLQPGQQNEAMFSLLAGNIDSAASEEARQLLVSRLNSPLKNGSDLARTNQVQLQTLRWFAARQSPTLVASAVRWMWNLENNSNALQGGNWIDAAVNFDIYNPAEEMPSGNSLQWTTDNGGWDLHAAALEIPALAQYQVHRVTARTRFDLTKINDESRQPLQMSFVDGFNGQSVTCKFSLPVAVSERRRQPLNVDGDLNDWFPADAIQLEQPLIRMLNRPGIQKGDLQLADSPSSVYTGWSDDNFYLAFRVAGVSDLQLRSTRNFVKYDHGRAWGEDLCEMVIQPIYVDNSAGPTMHVVCKPAGDWVERQAVSTTGTPEPWQDFEASGMRFASGIDVEKKVWRGEIAIPWKTIAAAGRGRPALLRFNFIQHQQATAQSSSWAGPIDDSRDSGISGLLLLKE